MNVQEKKILRDLHGVTLVNLDNVLFSLKENTFRFRYLGNAPSD